MLLVVLLIVTKPIMASAQLPTREILVRALQFSFAPNDIEVVEGERVRLLIEAIDVPHGVVIAGFGVRAVAKPGTDPTVLEFLADTPGRYRFICAFFCGNGHNQILGVLTVLPVGGSGEGRDHLDRIDDSPIDVVEPDFSLVTIPTTLRIPRNRFAFRLTHRFSRPLGGGPGFGNLLEDFFGFDAPAFIGFELRYGIGPGAQVAVYRNNNRNIQFSGKYNMLWSQSDYGIGLDAYVSVEGGDNFTEAYSPAFGAIVSKRLSNRAAVYAQPMWVGNTNRSLFHPELDFSSDETDSLMVGLGTRVRVLPTVNVVAEYVPRVHGFDNGDHHLSFAVEKRVGGHVFQANFSNGLGSSPAQIAAGGDLEDWFIGFNITRRFY